jgi:hypothetical protein
VGWGDSHFVFRQKLLPLLVISQDAGHKFGSDTVHAQFLRQNPLACPIINFHLLSSAGMVRYRSLRKNSWIRATVSVAVQLVGLPVCSSLSTDVRPTGLQPGMPLKHLRRVQYLVPEGLLNHCEGLRSTFPKTGTKFDAHLLFHSPIQRANRRRARTRLQINACENCPRPPS